jgi:hypothetical protein
VVDGGPVNGGVVAVEVAGAVATGWMTVVGAKLLAVRGVDDVTAVVGVAAGAAVVSVAFEPPPLHAVAPTTATQAITKARLCMGPPRIWRVADAA